MVIYICPTPGCGNFYASPEFREDISDLYALQQKRGLKGNELTHARVDCPDCRELHGLTVQRVPYIITGVVRLRKILDALKGNNAGNDHQGVPIRGSTSTTEPRREMPETSWPLVQGASFVYWRSLPRRILTQAWNGLRLRRREGSVEQSTGTESRSPGLEHNSIEGDPSNDS